MKSISTLARHWLLATLLASSALLPSLAPSWAQERSADNATAQRGAAQSAASTASAFAFEEVQHRTFNYFWQTAHPVTGLIPDRYPTPSFSSMAATGFGLTAYAIGAERGYVTRQAAAERTLHLLRFLWNAPQGDAVHGMAGYHGFFYRYLDMATGQRFGNIELSSVDTALLMGGVLFAGEYFRQDNAVEKEIRALSQALFERVDWQWMQPRPPAIAHGWMPDIHSAPADLIVDKSNANPTNAVQAGFLTSDWVGYNEAMLVYILALGSPTHPAQGDAFAAWSKHYDHQWGTVQGQTHLSFAPLFGHQYSHVWLDLRGVQDAFMQSKGIDYFENSRRATLAQQSYGAQNPNNWTGYSATLWGWAACDGPADVRRVVNGRERLFRTYSARGVGLHDSVDDGTIAPTAAASSLPFAPEVVLPTLDAMANRYGAHLLGEYGFFDAFNQSVPHDVALHHGHFSAGFGWVDTDYIGIDQGPIVAMFENYRSGLVWNAMRQSAVVRTGLRKAGFVGGWLSQADKSPSIKAVQ